MRLSNILPALAIASTAYATHPGYVNDQCIEGLYYCSQHLNDADLPKRLPSHLARNPQNVYRCFPGTAGGRNFLRIVDVCRDGDECRTWSQGKAYFCDVPGLKETEANPDGHVALYILDGEDGTKTKKDDPNRKRSRRQ